MGRLRAGRGFIRSFVERTAGRDISVTWLVLFVFSVGACSGERHELFSPGDSTEPARALRPGAVSDLAVRATEANEVTLQFHGVDDGIGGAARYEIRYAVSPLGSSWGDATSVSQGTCATPVAGKAIGELVECTVEGLRAGVPYDFQLVPFRGTLNKDAVFGPLSNVAHARTKGVLSGVLNEPPGFRELTERFFGRRNEAGWLDTGLEIVSGSEGSTGRMRFPRGFLDGRAPGRAEAPRFSYASVYSSFRIRFSSNWQGHNSSGSKIIFLTDNSEGGGGDPVFFAVSGVGPGPMHFEVRTQGPNITGRNLQANVGNARLERDRWHQIEVLVAMNRPGRRDGEVHVWVDGRKTHSYHDVHFVSRGSKHRFDSWRWGPVWGGNTGDVVRNDMYQLIDHVYISGR